MKVLKGMASELCPYFHTAPREKYLCSIKESLQRGKESELVLIECDSCDFNNCETYIRREFL